MRIRSLSIALLAVSGHAFGADFDINGYCQQVADVSGGSYQIEKMCRSQETRARDRVAAMDAPDRVIKYCDQVASVVGGSYQIMESCIQQELAAKADMQ